jgi:CO/xanthine dehydrogenase Mo-binding subunit
MTIGLRRPGLSELGSFAVAPAGANAIDGAVGARLTSLPLTLEAVLRAIRAKAGARIG